LLPTHTTNSLFFILIRSGEYAASLPSCLIVTAIYLFLLWMFLFLFLLFPVGVIAFCLLGFFGALLYHISAVFSLFGRIIIHSGAMGSLPILDAQMEAGMSSAELTKILCQTATTNREQGKSLSQLYPQVAFSTVSGNPSGKTPSPTTLGSLLQSTPPADHSSSIESLVDLEYGLAVSKDSDPLVSKFYSPEKYQSTTLTTI